MKKQCFYCDKDEPLFSFILGWKKDKDGHYYCWADWKKYKAFLKKQKREKEVSKSDLKAMEAYLNYSARQWWNSQYRDTAICDYCNSRIPKDGGYLVGYPGSTLICVGCMQENLPRLKENPNYFGYGLLSKARQYMATKK